MDTTPHRARHLALVAVAAAIGLAGCGGSETTETAAESPTPSETTTTTAPTATQAAPEQVASVIAGHESDWRETIDGAGDCRILKAMASTTVDEVSLMSCYTREVTMGITARNAIRDLNALDVPSSMAPLVEETTRALQAVADVDLEAACGPPMDRPNTTDECSLALGERFVLYGLLESALDKWRPYL